MLRRAARQPTTASRLARTLGITKYPPGRGYRRQPVGMVPVPACGMGLALPVQRCCHGLGWQFARRCRGAV